MIDKIAIFIAVRMPKMTLWDHILIQVTGVYGTVLYYHACPRWIAKPDIWFKMTEFGPKLSKSGYFATGGEPWFESIRKRC